MKKFSYLILFFATYISAVENILTPHLTGWYEPLATQQAQELLTKANTRLTTYQKSCPKIIITPHAGLKYSGLCTAAGLQSLFGYTKKINRVLVLATNHEANTSDKQQPVSLCSFNKIQFQDKLIDIDTTFVKSFVKKSFCKVDNNPFLSQHSFEIMLPFLTHLFIHAKLVPMFVASGASASQVKEIASEIGQHLKQDGTILICNSDLLHIGPSYQTFASDIEQSDSLSAADIINKKEVQVINMVLKKDVAGLFSIFKHPSVSVCGKGVLQIAAAVADELSYQAQICCHSSSVAVSNAKNFTEQFEMLPSDNYDDKKTDYVGYASFNFFEKQNETIPTKTNKKNAKFLSKINLKESLNEFEKIHLKDLVKKQIIFTLQNKQLPDFVIKSPNLERTGLGLFCTIKKNEQLHGCRGQTAEQGSEPVWQTLQSIIHPAAFEDFSRFGSNALELKDLDNLEISITLLSQNQKVTPVFAGKNNSLAIIREFSLGKHGVILQKNGRSALFLPSVIQEQKWSMTQTLEQLSIKAGLERQAYKEKGSTLYLFEGYEF